MKNLTPQHLRCDPDMFCPSVHQLDDGRMVIVGARGDQEAYDGDIGMAPGEQAVIVSPELLSGLDQTPSPQAEAPSGHLDSELDAFKQIGLRIADRSSCKYEDEHQLADAIASALAEAVAAERERVIAAFHSDDPEGGVRNISLGDDLQGKITGDEAASLVRAVNSAIAQGLRAKVTAPESQGEFDPK